MAKISKILLPSRPQSDTTVSIFLVQAFGAKDFGTIEKLAVDSSSGLPAGETFESLLSKGVLALDMGGGEFDHHGKIPAITCSELLAKKLGVLDDPALSKLFQYVRRCDMQGKGIISTDPIDKAFGLPGLITALNKTHSDDPTYVVSTMLPLIAAHHEEENRRTKEMPKEFEEAVKARKADIFEVRQRDKKLKVIIIETENMSMLGYLRSQMGGAFDVVARRSASGHVNILTRPTKKVDLRSLALVIRLEEGNKRGGALNDDPRHLSSAGKIPEVSNWYYDTATNSLLNGGSNPKDAEPTAIDQFTMRKLIEVGLSERLWSPIGRR
ncbi:MAG: hypothetical protein WC767_01210 [Candidatus Paceibacterota bacterium]|jgi:hypothetical protein